MYRTVVALVLSAFLLAAASAQTHKPAKKPSASSHRSSASAAKKKTTKKKTTKLSPQRSRKLKRAFVASTQLKPMAKQLLDNRSPAAYAAIEKYAAKHAKDDSGPLARLVLGFAHLQDRDYDAAIASLKKAKVTGGELNDYADYLLASAAEGKHDDAQVIAALTDFENAHRDSVLTREAEVMRANALLDLGKLDEAARELEAIRQPTHADVELVLGRVYAAQGDKAKSANVFNRLYCEMPLSSEAYAASLELKKLDTSGFVAAPTYDQQKIRAELLMKARRYPEAGAQYQTLIDSIRSDLSKQDEQRTLQVHLAGALYRQHRQSEAKKILDGLDSTAGETDAERLYYLHEIARNEDDGERERALVELLIQQHAQSPWLQETLLSAANMYLLRRDYPHLIEYSTDQYKLFPKGKYSPYAHWKAAWYTLRTGNNAEAARLFEEQIELYGGGSEIPAALYWRARLAEEAKDFNKAGNYYATLIQRFPHYYYTDLARQRLRFRFSAQEHDPLLDKVQPPAALGEKATKPPTDNERLARAKLLSNAALYDYAVRELQEEARTEETTWPELQIAELYLDDDRPQRALETLKRALPGYFAADIQALPRRYWELLFPRAYWDDLARDSRSNGLDPYLVASLIRQESEFNAAAVSPANAWGLMQLLPSVGRNLAKKMKVKHFTTNSLTDPKVNLELGTRYFREMVDDFGGHVEYALAAYNAGTDRVKDWRAAEQYRDVYEFVESIPFTETREYVQSIMRNMTIYKLLYSAPPSNSTVAEVKQH